MKQQLKLGFKGERDYIQGGDVFNAVHARLAAAAVSAFVSCLVFRRFARRDCDLLDAAPDDVSKLVAHGVASMVREERRFWIEESARPVVGHRAYDESWINGAAETDGTRIVARARSIYTPIEEVIALTKRLAYETAPGVDGKWVFGQLNLNARLPDDYSELIIEQDHLIANRFSTNSIRVDGRRCGEIRFIVARP